ncbi:PorP/SprF family type IX secretion system membrane protein [Parapedobacter koreensis]|uniref:Type IX secretion system membrane protein, PorP/SprF family n=1 Tax=Parapedobacter koreensis TaxID=332977 RepID=A0A1H7QSN9_9SPHI|nr:type IX secretion system membrane protein PorP/SprF [Parapedobacter koreensis]SEL50645.1 type IX secretion system membrane protein, PorP/SprF family [Parapedobacter koreensis]
MCFRSTNLATLLLCISAAAWAQQRPQYTQYIFNGLLANPAVAGIERYVDVKLGARSQWQGVEGAPQTAYLSAHMPIGANRIQDGATSFSEGGHNPYGRNFSRHYRASEPHHGAGVVLQHDRAGQFTRTDALLAYAYHLRIAETINLAAGVNAGVSQVRLDIAGINTGVPGDPALANYADSRLTPDLGFGLWLYSARFFVGLSAQQLLGNPLAFSNNAQQIGGYQQLFLMAGYKLHVSSDMAVVPSVLLKRTAGMPMVGDYNVKLAFRDRLWLGGGYRNHESFSAMAGFNISALFNLSYSYDFSTGPVRTLAHGSHEIVLGILLNNRFKVYCPQVMF